MKEYIKKPESLSSEMQRQLLPLINQIKSNKIPEKWDYYGLLSSKKSLIEFLRIIF